LKYEKKLIEDGSNINSVLEQMPPKRIIPPVYEWGEVPEGVVDSLPDALRKKPHLKVNRVFSVDADGDGELETIIFIDKPEESVYIVKNGIAHTIPQGGDDGYCSEAQFVCRYPVPRESPYLFLGGFGGSGGYPFGNVYRWDGSKYKAIPEMKEIMMKEFGIQRPVTSPPVE
jgi:hypothetical protein